jgi:hypothetical protein
MTTLPREIALFASVALSACMMIVLPTLDRNLLIANDESVQDLGEQRKEWDVRWLLLKYGNGELDEDSQAVWKEMQQRVRRAADVGYNGIVFADRDENWYRGANAKLWQNRLGELRVLTRTLGMQLLVACVPAKGGGTAEMAESFPVKDAPLVISSGLLVPATTAVIRNGSFEQFDGHTPQHFKLPEAGKHAFVDQHSDAHDGITSIRVDRFDEVRGRLAMPSQTVAVKPFHQYRVSFWLKISEDFRSTIRVMARVPGEGGRSRDICQQEPSIGRRTPRNEWFKVEATFNSWDNEQVELLVGPINWGNDTRGTFWLDQVQIEDVPFLNVNRRAELPNRIVGENGRVYVEGTDYEKIADPNLGLAWGPDKPGRFGVRQAHPTVRVLPGSALKDGQRVRYSGYHVGLYGRYYGKTPSMTSDLVFDMYAEQVRILRRAADPDGYLIWFDEMRVGGWEPEALKYETCGELINAALKRAYAIVLREGGGKPVHCWHDMLTPTHNAHEDYYLLRNTAAGAGDDLPQDLRIWIWGGGRRGAEHLAFFAKQGLHQILCTYYDTPDIQQQYDLWMRELEAAGVEADGVVYSTWGDRDGYRNIEPFAEVWWGNRPNRQHQQGR